MVRSAQVATVELLVLPQSMKRSTEKGVSESMKSGWKGCAW
ncbi:MAG: hypothetical protein ACYTF3_09010 [Planctomycetota bacterium]